MNIKRRLVGLSAAAAFTGIALTPLPVAADVARYQIATMQYTMLVNGVYGHDYTFTFNPCSQTFTGTGITGGINTFYETVTNGMVVGTSISFVGTYYTDPDYSVPVPYTFSFTGTLDSSGNATGTAAGFPATLTFVSQSLSTYKSHGAFVSAASDKNDAAHSCIGMPVNGQ